MEPRPSLYLDENVAMELAARLKASGFDVLTARDAGMLGHKDTDQLEFATSQSRILLTHDVHDFVRITREWATANRSDAGAILCPQHSVAELQKRILALLDRYERPDALANATVSI